MSEAVLDGDALAQKSSAALALRELAQSVLKRLVLSDGDGAAVSERRVGAARAQRAPVAGLGVEFDGAAGGEAFHLTRGTGNRSVAHVDVEGALGEELAVARGPGAADDGAASLEHVIDERRVDISTVDVELINLVIAMREVA